MSVQCLVFVRADGSTERTLVDDFPEKWIVRNGVPYERDGIAWKKDEGEENPHGAMVYVEVPPNRYNAIRNSVRETFERCQRDYLAMPELP